MTQSGLRTDPRSRGAGAGAALGGVATLVTGASGGIGAAVTGRLASAGAQLVLTGRDRAALDRLAGVAGAQVVPADLVDAGSADDLADTVGPVELLVHVAGAGWAGPTTAMPPADTARLVQVNLLAPMRLTARLLPPMIAAGRGHVVFVSSVAAGNVVPEESVYSATKAGLGAFAAAVREEVRGAGVGVSVIVPGVVDTPFFTRRGRAYDRRFPRPVPPEAVADAVLDAVLHDREEVFVPRWLRLPTRLHGGAPAAYDRLARRWR